MKSREEAVQVRKQQLLRLIRGEGERTTESMNDAFCGHLSNLCLTSLLHIVEMEAKTCSLRVEVAGRVGSLHCHEGRLLQATTQDGLRGLDAAHEIVTWENPEMEISPLVSPLDGDAPPLDVALEHVVLEAMRRQDEASQTTGGATLFDEGNDDIFDGAFVPPPLPFGDTDAKSGSECEPARPADPARPNEESSMTTIRESLQSVLSLNGAIGACLVDSSSGMMLGDVQNGDSFDLEVAAATNTEVVRAKRDAIRSLGLDEQIEDILITLGSQYHLIRPLGRNSTLFVYLVLLRDRANLAMARHRLAAVERDLEIGTAMPSPADTGQIHVSL
jgi:hypothetical protein